MEKGGGKVEAVGEVCVGGWNRGRCDKQSGKIETTLGQKRKDESNKLNEAV